MCERNRCPRHIANGAPNKEEWGERQPDEYSILNRLVDEICLAQPPIMKIGIVLLRIEEAISEHSCPLNIIPATAQQIGVDDQRIVIGESRAQQALLIRIALNQTKCRTLRISIHHLVKKRVGAMI